jgi:hypothetical protein
MNPFGIIFSQKLIIPDVDLYGADHFKQPGDLFLFIRHDRQEDKAAVCAAVADIGCPDPDGNGLFSHAHV